MTQTETHDSEVIERDIRRTQEEMSDTVNQIGDQMTPRRLFDALLEKADENGIDARYILDGARRNPLALGLIAAGAIWLLSDHDAKPTGFSLRSKRKDSSDYDVGDYEPDHRRYVEHMAWMERNPDEDDLAYTQRRDEHRGAFLMIERDHNEDHSSYRQRLDDATAKMREKRDNFTEGVRQTRENIAKSSRKAMHKSQDAYTSNPLLGGLAAAIVGAIAGSVIPASQAEREKLGPQGAKAIDKIGETAGDLGENAMDKKDDALAKVERKLTEQGAA